MALKNRIFNFAEFFRPKSLEDVQGNKVPLGILKTHLKRGKFRTGYLVLGPSGVGKTTTCYILALAANCADPIRPGKPCYKCESCLERGKDHPDIWVVNAASLNKAGDIEALIAKIKKHDVKHKKLCIIMDEWHNLTNNAREKLLDIIEAAKMTFGGNSSEKDDIKDLKEIETDYLFMLPTTSIHGMQEALLSRLTELHFKPLRKSEMRAYLTEICKIIGLKPNNKVFDLIFDKTRGALRKGLNLLEDIRDYSSSEGEDEELDLALAEEVLQCASSAIADKLFDSILNFDLDEANDIIKEHTDEHQITEGDFNELYILLEEFVSSRSNSIQSKLLPMLDYILDQRLQTQLSPFSDSDRRLKHCVIRAISDIENILLDEIYREIKEIDEQAYILVKYLDPGLVFDPEDEEFILQLNEPDDDYEYDFLDEDLIPSEFLEEDILATDFIDNLFDKLEITEWEYR